MSEIKRTDESPGVREYYSALQRILDLQRGVLTGVLTHRGERGRNGRGTSAAIPYTNIAENLGDGY